MIKEAVEGVLKGGGVWDGGVEEGSGLEVESGSTGVSQRVMSLLVRGNSSSDGGEISSNEQSINNH